MGGVVKVSALTDVLDLVGLLLVVAGVALAVGVWQVPAGVITGGVGVLVVSWVLSGAPRPKRRVKIGDRA